VICQRLKKDCQLMKVTLLTWRLFRVSHNEQGFVSVQEFEIRLPKQPTKPNRID